MAQNHSARPSAEITSVDILDEVVINEFSTVASVAASTPTTIVSYTVPADKTFYLVRTEASGCNIAEYEIVVNGSVEAMGRTYWSGPSKLDWEFYAGLNKGLSVAATEVILIRVTHSRTNVGDFEGRIFGILKG